MFLNKKKIVDERVVNIQNKIYKEIYLIVLAICVISMGVKFTLEGYGVEHVYTEMIILVSAGLYYSFRVAQLGIFSDEVEMHDVNSKHSYKKKMIIFGVILGIIIGIVMGVNSAFNYADSTGEAIYFFFLVFFVTLCIYAPLFIIAFLSTMKALEVKSKKVNEKMLEDLGE